MVRIFVTCSRHLTASRSEGGFLLKVLAESVSTGYSRAPHGSRKFFVIIPARVVVFRA